MDGQMYVKLEILGEWYLVPLCDNGCAYSAMIVKCFLASQYGVQPLILPDIVPSSKEGAFMISRKSRITYC